MRVKLSEVRRRMQVGGGADLGVLKKVDLRGCIVKDDISQRGQGVEMLDVGIDVIRRRWVMQKERHIKWLKRVHKRAHRAARRGPMNANKDRSSSSSSSSSEPER